MGLVERGIIGKGNYDTADYINSIENLFSYGRYTHTLGYLPASAGRMPGYGIVYGLLRLFLSKAHAYDGLVVSQIALAIVALYYLGKLAYELTQQRRIAYIVILVHAVSPYGAQPDILFLTESFAASALIIGSYYFLLGVKYNSRRNLTVAGAWLTWVIFLRPYMAPLLGFWLLLYGYYNINYIRQHRTKYVVNSLFFLLPFSIIDGAWTIRNWFVMHQFIPLQAPYAATRMTDVYLESRRFAAAFGEDPVEWNASSLMCWLTRPVSSPQSVPQSWQLTSVGTYDSLVWVRQRIQEAKTEGQLPPSQQFNSMKATAALRRFHDAVVRENPLLYYVIAPVRLTYYLVLTGGGNSVFAWPFGELARWQQGIRLFFTCTHWLFMGASLLSCLTWPQRISIQWVLIKLPIIYLLLLFVVGLRYVESRYFIVVYPLALLNGIIWLMGIIMPQLEVLMSKREERRMGAGR